MLSMCVSVCVCVEGGEGGSLNVEVHRCAVATVRAVGRAVAARAGPGGAGAVLSSFGCFVIVWGKYNNELIQGVCRFFLV